jgi:hypothetical protein
VQITLIELVDEALDYGLDVELERVDRATLVATLDALRACEPEIRPALVAHLNEGWPYWTFNR